MATKKKTTKKKAKKNYKPTWPKQQISYGSVEEWQQEAVRRFGKDSGDWKFVCPACGHVAAARDWLNLGAGEGSVAFSCVGRQMPEAAPAFSKGKQPCTYAGGGLFRLNPICVKQGGKEFWVFAFAEATAPTESASAESTPP